MVSWPSTEKNDRGKPQASVSLTARPRRALRHPGAGKIGTPRRPGRHAGLCDPSEAFGQQSALSGCQNHPPGTARPPSRTARGSVRLSSRYRCRSSSGSCSVTPRRLAGRQDSDLRHRAPRPRRRVVGPQGPDRPVGPRPPRCCRLGRPRPRTRQRPARPQRLRPGKADTMESPRLEYTAELLRHFADLRDGTHGGAIPAGQGTPLTPPGVAPMPTCSSGSTSSAVTSADTTQRSTPPPPCLAGEQRTQPKA